MRVLGNIFVLLPLVFQSISAIELPQSHTSAQDEESERGLLIFRERRCRRRFSGCRASLDVEELPIQEWSDSLAAREDEGEEDGLNVLEMIQTVLNLASTLDIGTVIANIGSSVGDGGLDSVINVALTVLQNAPMVFAALQDGDILAVVLMLVNILTDTSGLFTASDNDGIEQIIDGFLSIIGGIVELFTGLTAGIVAAIIYILESIVNFFVGLLQAFADAFDSGRKKKRFSSTSCGSDLLKCQYNTMMMESIPGLMSLAYQAIEEQK